MLNYEIKFISSYKTTKVFGGKIKNESLVTDFNVFGI
jgi:hypothetical protein